MEPGVIYLSALCAIFCAGKASHFRGGTASWRHHRSFDNTHEIEILFRFGWRRDYFSSYCDDETIANQQSYLSNNNYWYIETNSQDLDFYDPDLEPIIKLASTTTICTAYDPNENWSYGYNSVITNITMSPPFTIRHVSNAWISSLYFGADSPWSIALIDIDLDIRSDTGLVNRPPTVFSSPVVRLLLGCPETIQMPIIDQDGDFVRCRYAKSDIECGGICGQYQHFTLDSETCTISYDGGGGSYTIPVALMILDSPLHTVTMGLGDRIITPSDYFSQIPLQFLVQVTKTADCNVFPTYPPYAIPEGKIFTIPEEGTFIETLHAYPSAPSEAISQYIILGPLGLQYSPIYETEIYVYTTNISWSPNSNQVGKHSVCYYAVDEARKNGKLRCFEIAVEAISNPCEVDNGGCNDLCVPSGSVSTCVCTRLCWSLAVDRKTCIPDMEVTCSGEYIDISVATCSTNKTVVAGLSVSTFSQNACQSDNQGLDHVLKFSPLECDVIIQSNPIEVQYIMNIWTWEGETIGQGQSAITRGQWQSIPVTCSLATSTNVTGSFVPILPLDVEFVTENVAIEGLGSFTLYFEFYRGSNFLSAYGPLDFPLEVTVNDDIYFSLGAVGRGGLTFFTEECVAQSTQTITSETLQYTFIANGCLLDSTTTKYASPNAMENRFSIKAFEFENRLVVSQRNADIYIQCKVMLCDAAENNTRCTQLCLSTKRKRSVDSDENIRIREVRNVDDDDEETQEKPSLSESPLQDVTSRIGLLIDSEDNPDNDKPDDNNNEASINYSCLILLKICVILSNINW